MSIADLATAARSREATHRAASQAREEHARVLVIEHAVRILAERGFDDFDLAVPAIDQAVLERAGERLGSRAVDLGVLLREGVPPVDYAPGELARRMVYAAGVTGFTGHPESGKSSLVSRLALDAMREGQDVVYLDWENGEVETVRRFAALGADAELLSARLTYLPHPGPPDWEELGALWDARSGALGVWDSARGVLRSLGLDEDRAAEVGQFMDPLVEFAIKRNVPCLLIDHVPKAGNESSGYARGSGDKLAAVNAQWYVKRARPFSESEAGEISVVRWKARSGGLSRMHRFAVGDGEGNLTFRRLDPDESPQGRRDAAIIGFLRQRGEPCSQRDVETGVEGAAATLRDALKALADDPERPVRRVEGRAHARYEYARELDREPTARLEF